MHFSFEDIMSAIANITIADGATTPVNHVFIPAGSNPSQWEDSDAAKVYKASQYRVTTTRKVSNSTKGLTRVKVVVELPTMGNGVSLPASEVDYTHTFIIEAICPNRGLKQERKDMRVLSKNLLSDAQIVDVIDELRASFG
jgi:hypothetical protein